ncbi:MAG: oligosaccharide flippase family protein [Bacteroidales bacterium]|nr:oligosaccharide flippase family protein [Bacteroidales bacterium]
MQRKFLTNLALLLSLNLLIKPFWILGIDRSVQNIVGVEDYGFYFALFNFSFLFNILLDFGITNFNNKNIAQHNHLLNKYFSSIVIMKLILAVVYFIVTFSFGLIIGYNPEQLKLLALVGFNQFLLSFILYLRSNISGLLLFKTDSFLSVLDRVLMIIICSVLLWGNVTKTTFRIEWFVYAQTAAYVLTALIALSIVIKKAAFKKLKWNYPFFIMIIKQSFPFAVLVLLMTFYNRVDTVLIERILPGSLGDQQSGVYAQAYRLLDASNMIAFLFAILLLPIFSRMIKMKESVEQIVKLSFTLLITISVIVGIGSCFCNFELMELLYPAHADETIIIYLERIHQSGSVFILIILGFIPISTTYVFGTLLTANGSLKALNFITASGMLVSLCLNFILIPKLLALGSAYASVSSQYITAIVQVIVVQYIFKFRINYRYLLVLLVFVIGVILINIFSKQLHFNWMTNFILMVATSFILAFSLKLLNIKAIIGIIKKS